MYVRIRSTRWAQRPAVVYVQARATLLPRPEQLDRDLPLAIVSVAVAEISSGPFRACNPLDSFFLSPVVSISNARIRQW